MISDLDRVALPNLVGRDFTIASQPRAALHIFRLALTAHFAGRERMDVALPDFGNPNLFATLFAAPCVHVRLVRVYVLSFSTRSGCRLPTRSI